MYKCEFCNLLIQRNISSFRVIVEARRKIYPFRKEVIWGPDDKHPWKYKWNDDPGGSGYEIVKEMIACPDCEKKAPKIRRNG
jgi:hypothetical protein